MKTFNELKYEANELLSSSELYEIKAGKQNTQLHNA